MQTAEIRWWFPRQPAWAGSSWSASSPQVSTSPNVKARAAQGLTLQSALPVLYGFLFTRELGDARVLIPKPERVWEPQTFRGFQCGPWGLWGPLRHPRLFLFPSYSLWACSRPSPHPAERVCLRGFPSLSEPRLSPDCAENPPEEAVESPPGCRVRPRSEVFNGRLGDPAVDVCGPESPRQRPCALHHRAHAHARSRGLMLTVARRLRQQREPGP